jgi:hypothetical protein
LGCPSAASRATSWRARSTAASSRPPGAWTIRTETSSVVPARTAACTLPVRPSIKGRISRQPATTRPAPPVGAGLLGLTGGAAEVMGGA